MFHSRSSQFLLIKVVKFLRSLSKDPGTYLYLTFSRRSLVLGSTEKAHPDLNIRDPPPPRGPTGGGGVCVGLTSLYIFCKVLGTLLDL